jgi:hypothetical protein
MISSAAGAPDITVTPGRSAGSTTVTVLVAKLTPTLTFPLDGVSSQSRESGGGPLSGCRRRGRANGCRGRGGPLTAQGIKTAMSESAPDITVERSIGNKLPSITVEAGGRAESTTVLTRPEPGTRRETEPEPALTRTRSRALSTFPRGSPWIRFSNDDTVTTTVTLHLHANRFPTSPQIQTFNGKEYLE